MRIDHTAKEAVVTLMEQRISELKDAISAPKPQDNTEKDNAATWWRRGQVFALSQMISTIMEDDNDN